MGFFDRIKSMLRKEEKPKELSMSLEEILDAIEKINAERSSAATEDSHKRSVAIYSEVQSLKRLIESLDEVKREGLLRGSSVVKEQFYMHARNQLASIAVPEKNLKDITDFLERVNFIMENLGGITPRQMIHIEYSFKDEFLPIIKKAREISVMIKDAKNTMGGFESYENIRKMHESMGEIDNRIKAKRIEEESLKREIESIKEDEAKIMHDIGKLHDDSETFEDIDEMEGKIDMMKQEITSFLSIEKLLRRLAHEKGEDPLLDLYTISPVKALIRDENYRITSFAKEALDLDVSDIDEKKLEKARMIISSRDKLEKMRRELMAAMDELSGLKDHAQNVIMPAIEKKKRLENDRKDMESEIADLYERIEKIPAEILELEQAKNDVKESIAVAASSVLDASIKLKN